MNPQFHIQIPRSGAAKCHVVVSVTQQYETNVTNNKKKRTLHHIGFAVYEVPPNMTRLTPQYVQEHVSHASQNSFFHKYWLNNKDLLLT